MKRVFTGLVCCIFLSGTFIFSQNVAINITGAVANTSAMLDVDATNKGILIPRVALSATNSNAPVGATVTTSLMVYNTATASAGATAVSPGYYYWDGSQWVRMLNTGTAWQTLGNYGTNPATNFAGTIDNQDFAFRTNNTEKMRITAAGSAGIGTTTPLERLHIVGGNVRISNLAGVGNRMAIADANGTLGIIAPGTAGQVLTQTAGGPAWQTFTGWLVGGNTLAAVGRFGTNSAHHIDLATNNVVRGRWLSTGELLIGSTTLIAPAVAGDKFSAFITAATNNWAINAVNTSTSGGSLYAQNTNGGNPYNAFEGITNGTQNGVFGLHIVNNGVGRGGTFTTNSSNANAYGLYCQMPAGSPGWALFVNGDAVTTGAMWYTSDSRLKTNIVRIESPLQKLMQINGFTYNFKPEYVNKFGLSQGNNMGVLAEEVEAIFPELIRNTQLASKVTGVEKGSNTTEYLEAKTVNYNGLIPVMIEAIKEQQGQIELLQKKIVELESQIKK